MAGKVIARLRDRPPGPKLAQIGDEGLVVECRRMIEIQAGPRWLRQMILAAIVRIVLDHRADIWPQALQERSRQARFAAARAPGDRQGDRAAQVQISRLLGPGRHDGEGGNSSYRRRSLCAIPAAKLSTRDLEGRHQMPTPIRAMCFDSVRTPSATSAMHSPQPRTRSTPPGCKIDPRVLHRA